MSLASSISRAREYYKRHGLADTVRRAGVAAWRSVFANRMVVYSCDLTKLPVTPVQLPAAVKIARLRSERELTEEDRKSITSFWNADLARRNIRERFAKGASLWTIRADEKLAGYGWTLQGSTIEPYFFPLQPEDVHLFDFHVLSEFRGRGLNPLLVKCILKGLTGDCAGRALIEAAEWNHAQLSSLEKTPFVRMGMVRSFEVLGRTLVHWVDGQAAEGTERAKSVRRNGPAMVRPHER